MDPIVEFASEQWILFAMLGVIVALLVKSFLSGWGVKSVAPSEAVALINRENAVVLDVRTDDEFKQGHILNSKHIPVGLLSNRIGELEKHKATPIVVVCRTSNRSTTACAELRKQGFTPIYMLAGGIVAWQNANLPLTK